MTGDQGTPPHEKYQAVSSSSVRGVINILVMIGILQSLRLTRLVKTNDYTCTLPFSGDI